MQNMDNAKSHLNMAHLNANEKSKPMNNSNKIPLVISSSPNLRCVQSSPGASSQTKRIINRIPLDFKKLKEAGLDRKLAEALSKQNSPLTKKIASAPSSSPSSTTAAAAAAPTDFNSNSAGVSAAALPTNAATPIQMQIQRNIQNANVTTRKRKTEDLVPINKQSQQLRALLKHKILNKQSDKQSSPTTAATISTKSSPAIPSANRSDELNSPLPPVVTVTPAQAVSVPNANPPLLLNLVNQLPKHRARCSVSVPQSKPRPHLKPTSTLMKAEPPALFITPAEVLSSTNSNLRLQQQDSVSTANQLSSSMPPLIVLENKVLTPEEKIDLRALRLPKIHTPDVASLSQPVIELNAMESVQIPEEQPAQKVKLVRGISGLSPGLVAKKVILNPNKLQKLPKEKLAQMAKDISRKTTEKVEQIDKNSSSSHIQQPLVTSLVVVKPATDFSTKLKSTVSTEPSLVAPEKHVTGVSGVEINSPSKSLTEASTAAPAAVSSTELSAVDFITQLKANQSTDTIDYTDLSAEELSFNAKFSGWQTPCAAPAISIKVEEELPIGKILKMDDFNILDVTLNVNGSNPNVLCISPNSNKAVDQEVCVETTEIIDSQPAELLNAPPPDPQLIKDLPRNEVQKSPTKEEKPKATAAVARLPIRSRRGKINLVQRTKRPQPTKPKEPIKFDDDDLLEDMSQDNDIKIEQENTKMETNKVAVTEKPKEQKKSESELALEDSASKRTQLQLEQEVAEDSDSHCKFESSKEHKNLTEDTVNTQESDSDLLVETIAMTFPEEMKTNERLISLQISTNDSTKNTTEQIRQATEVPQVSTIERDLNQLYHPPKMPRNKQKQINNNNNEEEEQEALPVGGVNLLEIISQRPDSPQGEAQVPFRAKPAETSPSQEGLGIQNLLNHLTAEKVVVPPPSKPNKELEKPAEVPIKVPRKKLVKTRPVLNARKASKSATEALHPRKRALLAESNRTNRTSQRTVTSSTSDDDSFQFHGFDSETSNCAKNLTNETDISDDATPDYDETEDDRQPDEFRPVENKNKSAEEKVKEVKELQETSSEATTKEQDKLEEKIEEKLETKEETESQVEPEVPPVAPKRKRGRPPKKAKDLNISQVNNPETEPKKEPENTRASTSKRKRQSTPKAVALVAKEEEAEQSTSENTPLPKRQRLNGNVNLETPKTEPKSPATRRSVGRPRMNPVKLDNVQSPDYWPPSPDFNLRLLLIRNRDQLETDENLREDGRGQGDLQCGFCLVRCDEGNWRTHLKEHYGVGWTIDEAPKELSRCIVLKQMSNYLKANGNRLNCRLCDRALASGLGMLLHLEGCGAKKERVQCEVCKRSYTKLSFPQHSRTCVKQEPKTENDSSLVVATDEDNSTIYSTAGRAKRKSTIKAESKLQKLSTLAIKDEDNKDFERDGSDYDVGGDNESSDEDGSEGVDSDEEAIQTDNSTGSATHQIRTKRRKRKICVNDTTPVVPLWGRLKDLEDLAASRWKFFVKENYTRDVLFAEYLPRFEKLLSADVLNFLPSKGSTSMRYSCEDEQSWTQMAPFECMNRKNEHICHLGKPIKELEWVPLPPTVDTQYLLCSLRSKMLEFNRQSKDTREDCLLLLLKCSATKEGDWSLKTSLHYGISLPNGPVHSFAFMPSGGYDKASNRLALLAVGSSAGAFIYSLPLKLSEQDMEQDAVIVPQPIVTLSFDINSPVRDPCTCIRWSESLGHQLIVSGYASGYIAFWDIGDEDGINCLRMNNELHFLPINSFYFGERNIRELELHYDTNEARWLAAASSSRQLWIYDIANLSQPIPMMEESVHNIFIASVKWPSLWEALLFGCSELSRTEHCRIVVQNPSGIIFSQKTFDFVVSGARSMHFSCNQLVLAVVCVNGDIVLLQTRELNMESMLTKRMTNYRSLYTTEACYLNAAEAEPKSLTPVKFTQDYGLLMKPGKFISKEQKFNSAKRLPSFHLRSMMQQNCVRWNWNTPASNWVAVGAEHGLLRIIKYTQ